MNRLSTIIQDRRVIALRRKGRKRSYIAFRLSLSFDQVRNAERREYIRRKADQKKA